MKALRRALLVSASLAGLVSLAGCSSTSHPTTPATLGVAASSSALEAVVDQPGPVTVRTFVAAEWEVPRSGLINLDHPVAKAANLKDGPEPIKLFVHAVRHPTKGLFIVDTGVEHAFVSAPGHALVNGMFASLAHADKLEVHIDTAAVLAELGEPVQGVLLTHLHMDHVLGTRDVPASVPLYVGAGDAADRSFMNALERGIYDEALAGKAPLREVHFSADPGGEFDGVIDVFGDGTFWALSVPGHTPGSIAFVARTPDGPVLLTGDACHTSWGWEHGVEPGTFSDDRAKSADSLGRLKRFAAAHPRMQFRLGHQELAPAER
jgi:glyoxylase-like metal-dependent hydrolase (beta-lactamase superfamily II)